MEKQIIYIATYAEDGQPCCSSFTREGLQIALDKWNGFGEDPKIIISDKHTYVYKYGGESLIEYIIYKDDNISHFNDGTEFTKYNIWLIEID